MARFPWAPKAKLLHKIFSQKVADPHYTLYMHNVHWLLTKSQKHFLVHYRGLILEELCRCPFYASLLGYDDIWCMPPLCSTLPVVTVFFFFSCTFYVSYEVLCMSACIPFIPIYGFTELRCCARPNPVFAQFDSFPS